MTQQDYSHQLLNMVFDHDDIKSGNWITEPGQYEVEVINVEPGVSDNGKSRANITFEDKKTGMIHKEFFYLSKESLWRLKILVNALGIYETGQWLKEIINRTCIIELRKTPSNKTDDKGNMIYYNNIKNMWRSSDEIPQKEETKKEQINREWEEKVESQGGTYDPF